MKKSFAKVSVNILHKDVDFLFSYLIPDNLINDVRVGSMVVVPFGKNNKRYDGYVMEISDHEDYDSSKIKTITGLAYDLPIFSEEQIKLAMWMQEKYFSTLASCLKIIKPLGVTFDSDFAYSLAENADTEKLSPSEKALVEYIKNNKGNVLEKQLVEEYNKRVLTSLEKLKNKGVLIKEPVSSVGNLTLSLKYVFLNEENENLSELIDIYSEQNYKYKMILDYLLEYDKFQLAETKALFNISDSPIKTLEKKGLLTVKKIEVVRDLAYLNHEVKKSDIELNEEQKNAVETIVNMGKSPVKKPILLFGITGSGKTEVYLNAIEQTLKEGKTAIVLVPEIALTSQIVRIFVERFGKAVAVTHSRMSAGERHDQWKKAFNGEVKIMIGPRSALFTPLKNVGIIIIDEEHEGTYKSEMPPKYSAIEVAEKLAELHNATLVLGSATPKIESFYKAEIGEYELVTIKERVNKNVPSIEVCDMREELAEGNRSIFSKSLQEAMVETIESGRQMILFVNRRGFSTFVSCRSCGTVMSCENCEVNYTYHKNTNTLCCHYCGKTLANPTNCSVCGSTHIRYFGIGTQKIEDEIKNLFPNESILRMDFDTTSEKYGHDKIINKFKNKESKILIGTQMIAKGLDFPEVTLVGIVAADLSIHAGDFKSAENTFQLLTQVSGRAGRSSYSGRVFIQTYNPEHYSIKYAKALDYESFYKEEIAFRRQLNYPPFTNIFHIQFTGEDEKKIIVLLHRLLSLMEFYNRKKFFEMLGPTPSVVSKINNKFRWNIIVKGEDEDLLKMFVLHCMKKLEEIEDCTGITISLALNPNRIT